jgi:hypothetical protein
MRKTLLLLTIAFLININQLFAQYYGSFVVQGDPGKYYPVTVQDVEWSNNKATEFDIGRSNIHTDASWRGLLIAKFQVHTTDYGHGSNFIDASIRQFDPENGKNFIAGWTDGTTSNGEYIIIIWLQGGGNTYYINAKTNINPVVYDGIQHALPYQETNGPARTYKTSIDSYVNSNGFNSTGTAYYAGGTTNYFAGDVGIGTTTPDTKLAVNGTIHSTEVKVDLNVPGPDYVFDTDYKLTDLNELKSFLKKYHHLPDVPSAEQMFKNRINLSVINMQLLKKIEELTLYLIEKDKQVTELRDQVNESKQAFERYEKLQNEKLLVIERKLATK